MQLDYVPSTKAFTLRVGRGEADPKEIMHEHGFDFSSSASTTANAVLFTREHYAACPFAACATAGAREVLRPLLEQIELSERMTSNAHIRCPADKELMAFQKADVDYALRRKNTLVGDQPGLGKTPTAICYANEIGARRVLVICPANIRLQWARRIREWSTMRWPYVVYPILTGSRGVNPDAQWTIVSYDLARTAEIGAALARGTYDLLIIDEAHYAKEHTSQRTQALFGDHTGWMRRPLRDPSGSIVGYENLFPALASRCGSIMALTGTPLPNRPREAYTLARGLCFDSIDWMSEDSFRDRFNPSAVVEVPVRSANGEVYYKKRVIERAGRHGELQSRMRANFMCRHEKRHPEIMKQMGMAHLPVFDVIHLEPTAAVKQALEAERLLDIDFTDESLFKQEFDTAGDVARARHLMGMAMAPLAAEYANMLLDGGEDKLFIGVWHIAVGDIIQRKLERHGVLRIDGSVSAANKQRIVDEYVAAPKKKVLIGNILSAGTGTDGLQAVCSHLLLAECSWVSGENQQIVDRLDRMGQAGRVQADFLVAPGSIGEMVLTSSLRKLHETDKVLDRKVTWRQT